MIMCPHISLEPRVQSSNFLQCCYQGLDSQDQGLDAEAKATVLKAGHGLWGNEFYWTRQCQCHVTAISHSLIRFMHN